MSETKVGTIYTDVYGNKFWWIEGQLYTEEDYNKKIKELNKKEDTCDGKVVTIDGK